MKMMNELNECWDVTIHVVKAELRVLQLCSRRRARLVGVTRQVYLGGSMVLNKSLGSELVDGTYATVKIETRGGSPGGRKCCRMAC